MKAVLSGLIIFIFVIGAVLVWFVTHTRTVVVPTYIDIETGTFLSNVGFPDTIVPISSSTSDEIYSSSTEQEHVVESAHSPALSFYDSFDGIRLIEEAGTPAQSNNKDWWVSSGAWFENSDGVGQTPLGDISKNSRWYEEYKHSNPVDTDNGLHPQNIFRLVEIRKWKNFEQEVYTKVIGIHDSESTNRNASNGVLLFNRYQTGDDLYYAGIRTDGQAVIKKKQNGIYYTLAKTVLFSGSAYDREDNQNLIPLNTWIGLKTNVYTDMYNNVHISFYLDIGRTGSWNLILEALDDGTSYGRPILRDGFTGIRTDFMDVQFDNYSIQSVD